MKPVTLNEVRRSRSNLIIQLTVLIKKFTESGYEAVQIEDKDLEKNNGWIKKLNGKTYSNAAYIRKKAEETITALKLEDIVGIKHSKGNVYLYRKDI